MLFEIGTVCIKLAGRDAGKKCVIIDVVDDVYVFVDGETRRRKCNVAHLEPLASKLDIKKGASEADVAKAFETVNVKYVATKPKKAAVKPQKVRMVSKDTKKSAKKASTKA
ncbi:50S ribosomal protein L14e [Candidatus Woesearchaeota archaeon]|nr:50S ribosomal protein L14e [Candidatus Woesearchaeota archaeon]